MNWQRMTWPCVLAVVLAVSWFAAANANSLLRGRPTAVAVCDVQKAFDALEEKDSIEAELRTGAERLKEQEDVKKKRIRELQADMEILAKGSPAWLKKKEELETAAIELQVWRQFENAKLNRERGVQIENLYRKMIDSIGRVAAQNAYDLVMFKEKPVQFQGAKPEQIPTIIQVRKVLWSSDDLDITDLVIQEMNNQFRNR